MKFMMVNEMVLDLQSNQDLVNKSVTIATSIWQKNVYNKDRPNLFSHSIIFVQPPPRGEKPTIALYGCLTPLQLSPFRLFGQQAAFNSLLFNFRDVLD